MFDTLWSGLVVSFLMGALYMQVWFRGRALLRDWSADRKTAKELENAKLANGRRPVHR